MKHSNIAFFIPHIGCPNRCSFCNQNTISGEIDVPRANDIINVLKNAVLNKTYIQLKNTEIAFFGGSFTAIEREYMTELLDATRDFVGEEKIGGIRISTRPDAINEEILEFLKRYNVTSIELGAQSMCDDVLLKNLRGHTSNQVEIASNLIKKHGFSLGLQMMTGLYGDTENGAITTANKIIALKPDTVRIYPTVVLKDTYLEKLYLQGVFYPFDIEKTVSLCAHLVEMFEKNEITVIRIGLHDKPSLKENFVAGAYHPALGELILGEIMFNKIKTWIENCTEKNITIKVNPKNVSQVIGQKKRNIERFTKLGYNLDIISDNSVVFNDIKFI